jgi:hypothetical protein
LRVHTQESLDNAPLGACLSSLQQLCLTLSEVTGWQFHSSPTPVPDATWSEALRDADGAKEHFCVVRVDASAREIDESRRLLIAESAAIQLMKQLYNVAEHIRNCESALKAREAELAAAIPVGVNLAQEGRLFAERLQAVLRSGTQATRTERAALFVLDDATQFLKLRSHVGLRTEAFLQNPRPLRFAKADLEALAGHAVVLTSSQDFADWCVPEECESAVCVPVSSSTTLLGTLWCFGDASREFSDEQVNMLEIVAGRIAVELEREALLRERFVTRERTEGPTGSRWENEPHRDEYMSDDWELASRVSPSELDRRSLVGIQPTQQHLQITSVFADSEGVVGSTQAADTFLRLRSAAPAVVRQSLLDIHQQLYRTSTGDTFLSAARIDIDRATGSVRLFGAGAIEAFAIRPHGWEQLVRVSPSLGDASALDHVVQAISRLGVADWLLMLIGDRLRSVRVHDSLTLDGSHLAEILLRHNHLSADAATTALWRLLDEQVTAWHSSPSLILVRRKSAVQVPIDHVGPVISSPAMILGDDLPAR